MLADSVQACKQFPFDALPHKLLHDALIVNSLRLQDLVPYFKESSTQKFSPVQDLNVKSRGGWEHTIVKTLIFKWRACDAQSGLQGKNSTGEPTRPPKPKVYACDYTCDALSILFIEHIGFGYLMKKK